MIKISIENVEGLEPGALRRVGGLFSAIADYVHRLDSESREAAVKKEMSAKEYLESLEPAPPVMEEIDPTHTPAPITPVSNALVDTWFPPAPQAYAFPEHQSAGIDVDSDGVPWDGRIHASSRAKVAGGQWRMKRGVDPETITVVTGELRQMLTLGAEVPPPPISIVPPAPFVPNVVPPVPQVPTIPTVSAGAAAGASPSSATPPNAFFSLMKGITAGYAAKTLTQDMISAAVTSVGVPSLPMLVQRPDLIPGVATALGIAL